MVTDPQKRIFQSYFGLDRAVGKDKITGMSATGVILDDVEDRQKLPPYKTVGVRFIYGDKLDKIYTYRVRKGAKLYLGQEVIAPTKFGKRIVVIVEIHKTKQDTGFFNYLFIEQKAGPL